MIGNNQELLFALSSMFDEKLAPIKEDIAELKSDVSGLKKDVAVLKNDVSGLQKDVSVLKTQVSVLTEDVIVLKRDVRRNQLLLENDVLPRLSNIEECYTSTYDRYRTKTEQMENMQSDIDVLKSVVKDHSHRLRELSWNS
ncbi:MAG: hypothetical protein Q4C60_11965 [Eubacteriales bacterium]|nr:hypothetical protein [Eubacteriales bacterium]